MRIERNEKKTCVRYSARLLVYLYRCDVTIHACNVQGFSLVSWNSHGGVVCSQGIGGLRQQRLIGRETNYAEGVQ